VKLRFESSTAFSSSKSDEVTAVVKYLQEYGKASTAYNDLRPFVECLSSDQRKQLLEILKTDAVFSDAEEAGTRIYPAKEDVYPQLPIRVYWIQMTN
jgi:N-terminal acetyltransferase B complex non-catalytic subunit